MRKILAFALMSITASMAHAKTQAESDELYVGVAGTRSELRNYFADAGLGDAIDRTDDGLKFIAGYKLTRRVAAELSYIDKISIQRSMSGSAGSIASNADVSAFAFNVVAAFPVGDRFDVLGKVGFGLWKIEDVTESVAPSLVTTTTDYISGSGLSYGVGANYKLSDSLKLRAEYDVIEVVGDLELRSFSAGVIWQF